LKCVAFIRSVSLTYTNKDCNMYKKNEEQSPDVCRQLQNIKSILGAAF